MLMRPRLALAAIVVLSSLLAASARFKSATCGCGSSGLPWETIALVATVVAATSAVAYVAVMATTQGRHTN